MKLRLLQPKDLQEFVTEFLQSCVTVSAIFLHCAAILAIDLHVHSIPQIRPVFWAPATCCVRRFEGWWVTSGWLVTQESRSRNTLHAPSITLSLAVKN